jgi:hypothetical protein
MDFGVFDGNRRKIDVWISARSLTEVNEGNERWITIADWISRRLSFGGSKDENKTGRQDGRDARDGRFRAGRTD